MLNSTDPVVSSLVFVINPVKFFVCAILNAVLGDPLVSVAAALREDPRDHHHLLQVDLQPLTVVLEFGQPCTPWRRNRDVKINSYTMTVML